MAKPFKFRYVNEITGVFVLLMFVLLLAGIYFGARAQGLFESKFELYAFFTSDQGAFGLKKGSEIKIREASAGMVKEIGPNPEGVIQATFEIKQSYHSFIRTSSKAVVKKTLLLTGDSYVEILIGDNQDPLIPNGGTIVCERDVDLSQQLMQTLEDFRAVSIPAIKQFNVVLNDVPGLIDQLNQTLAQVEILMREDVPELSIQAQKTMRELQVLIEALQQNWLVRDYIERPAISPLLSPIGADGLSEGEEQ